MTEVKLNTFIPAQNCRQSEHTFNRYDLMVRPYLEWFVPTEVVVSTPQIVTPQTARVWDTALYLVDEQIVDYQALYKIRGSDFKGTSYEESIYLIEIWNDHGSDGHTNYRHDGYAFIPGNDMPKRLEGGMTYPDSDLPWDARYEKTF